MKQSKLSRRNFLLAAGAGSAAAAAAIAAKTLPQAQPVGVADDKRKTRGYQLSAHVNNYYRTAKV